MREWFLFAIVLLVRLRCELVCTNLVCTNLLCNDCLGYCGLRCELVCTNLVCT